MCVCIFFVVCRFGSRVPAIFNPWTIVICSLLQVRMLQRLVVLATAEAAAAAVDVEEAVVRRNRRRCLLVPVVHWELPVEVVLVVLLLLVLVVLLSVAIVQPGQA